MRRPPGAGRQRLGRPGERGDEAAQGRYRQAAEPGRRDLPRDRQSEPGGSRSSRLADRLIEQIRGGANFAAVAQQFSQSPSAAVGGDIGWVTPSELSPLPGRSDREDEPRRDVVSDPHAGRVSTSFTSWSADARRGESPTRSSLVARRSRLPARAEGAAATSASMPRRRRSRSRDDGQELRRAWRRSGRERAPQLSRQIPQIKASDLPADQRQQVLALKVAEPSKPIADARRHRRRHGVPAPGPAAACRSREQVTRDSRARAARRAGAALHARSAPRRLCGHPRMTRAARAHHGRAGRHRRRDHAQGLAAARATRLAAVLRDRRSRRGSSAWRRSSAGTCRSRPIAAPEDAAARFRRARCRCCRWHFPHRSCRAGPIPPTRRR